MLNTPVFASAVAALAFGSIAMAQVPVSGNQVEISVLNVDLPSTLPGACTVTGRINRVYTGKRFKAGQSLKVQVPCSDGRARMQQGTPLAVSLVVDARVLKASRLGIANLDDNGRVIFYPEGQPITRGDGIGVMGYRVLDGVPLPLSPLNSVDRAS